jgi:hypothetical protein
MGSCMPHRYTIGAMVFTTQAPAFAAQRDIHSLKKGILASHEGGCGAERTDGGVTRSSFIDALSKGHAETDTERKY